MKIDSTEINTIEPNSTNGKIRNTKLTMIKAISRSRAWHALYLTKQGILGFLTTPAYKIRNNNNSPKGNEFSIIATGQIRNKSPFKKVNLQNKKYPKGIEAFNGRV